MLAPPSTESFVPGWVVPMPTLEFEVSKDSRLDPMFKALTVAEAKVHVEADPAERLSAPAEVKARIPEVVVCKVRLLPATLNEDAAPEAMATAPAELFPIDMEPVEEPVLIKVLYGEEALIEAWPPAVVKAPVLDIPDEVVKSPELVRVPDVETLPEELTAR